MKNKVLTLSFDDCEVHDRRLCDMLRRYGLKATFFLITDQLGFRCDFHRYGEDTVVQRVSPEEIPETYQGMEVATHTANHRCTPEDLEQTVLASAKKLETLCGYPVRGMAYPGGVYTPAHIAGLRRLGFVYARTATVTHSFALPRDWLAWDPTCKYDDPAIERLADEFLHYSGETPALFHIYGHSYELTQKQPGCDWASFERLLQKLAGREDILYATNIEAVEALQCMA